MCDAADASYVKEVNKTVSSLGLRDDLHIGLIKNIRACHWFHSLAVPLLGKVRGLALVLFTRHFGVL